MTTPIEIDPKVVEVAKQAVLKAVDLSDLLALAIATGVLQAAAPLLVAGEREAAAKIADDYNGEGGRFHVDGSWTNTTPDQVYNTAATDVSMWIAAAIRQRGKP